MHINVLFASANDKAKERFAAIMSAVEDITYDLFYAKDVDELMDVSRSSVLDVLIADSGLPGGDIYSAYEALNKDGISPKLIVFGDVPSLAYPAITNRADGFLLFPFDADMLRSAICRAANELHGEAADISSWEYRKVIGRLFLDRNRLSYPENLFPVEIVNDIYNTAFIDGAYRVLVICIDTRKQQTIANAGQRLDALASGLYEHVMPLSHEMLLRFAKHRVHILLNYPPEKDAQICALLSQRLNIVRAGLPNDISVSFCSSERHEHIQDIQLMAEESMDACWRRFTAGSDSVLYFTRSSCPPHIKRTYDTIEKALEIACYELDEAAFEQGLKALFSLPPHIVGRCETRHLLRRVEYYMLSINQDLISSFTNFSKIRRQISQKIQAASSIAEYAENYIDALTSIFNSLVERSGGRQSQYIRLAKQYIMEHLDKRIFLQDISSAIGISPVYLSSLFVKTTGDNISDYINLCRVEKAKEMLLDRSAKNETIARSLGFCDAHYFSRIFKKIVGMTPKEYRAAQREI